jgi:hypothetical protein
MTDDLGVWMLETVHRAGKGMSVSVHPGKDPKPEQYADNPSSSMDV